MGIKRKIVIFSLCAVIFLPGCLFQRYTATAWKSFFVDLPERIYLYPEANPLGQSRVAVFRFAEPDYAPGTGKVAAEAVFDGLIKEGDSSISKETEEDSVDIVNCLNVARSKGYDLIITGEVLYYFDGSMSLSSCVNERINVIDVPTRRIIWSASTVSKSDPCVSKYYYLSSTTGSPARPAIELIERNAEKFCNMLVGQSSDQAETGADTIISGS